MTQQYIRKCSLLVGDTSGNNIELSQLHVKFTVYKSDKQSPAYADIRVYNLSDATARLIQNEYTRVSLSAGYEGNYGLIFSGTVRQFRKGRENATDSYLDILAQDGDIGYNFAVANTTLAAGWKQADLHAAVMKAFADFDIQIGYVPTFGGPAMPRGKVCYGMARDYLRCLAESAGTSWHIENGAVNLVPVASALPGEAQVLNSMTGMIGLPQQTINGVTVKCLLNPKIRFAGLVQIDNASIQQSQFNVAYDPGFSNQSFKQNGTGADVVQNTSLDADGTYKVFQITMTGDTRGDAWYFDLICVAINGTAPLAGPYINATASSTGF